MVIRIITCRLAKVVGLEHKKSSKVILKQNTAVPPNHNKEKISEEVVNDAEKPNVSVLNAEKPNVSVQDENVL